MRSTFHIPRSAIFVPWPGALSKWYQTHLVLRMLLHLHSHAACHLSFAFTGELYDQIQKRKQIDLADARIYAAEIVLMLQKLRQEKASLLSILVTCPMYECQLGSSASPPHSAPKHKTTVHHAHVV